MTYRVKNWDTFQHYSNRCPPWIRLHRDIMNDSDFWEISGDDYRRLTFLWLLASEDKDMSGRLPSVKNIAFRLRMRETDVAKLFERLSDWIVNDSPNVAECKQDASNALASCKQDATSDQIRSDQRRSETKSSFDMFWSVYPKKIGKGAARKAFAKAYLPSISDLLSIIAKQGMSEQWRKDGGQFIPNPATWLNQERWTDEIDTTPDDDLLTDPHARRELSDD